MGSLWASFEIIVGSFLHNLHVPFSGTILSFTSVFIIIAFIQFWNDRGLVWRAGLICALMKSISPSAVIIGPMIGILTEALVIELFIRITGKNLVSYMLGGGLAVASTLLHKLVSLLILYGMDLVKIFEGMVQYANKQLNFSSLNPTNLILLLVLIYFLAGIIAAILGYLSGKKFVRSKTEFQETGSIPLEQKSRLFQVSGGNRYSAVLILVHLSIIILSMWLINKGNYFIFLPLTLVYIISCFIWYKKSLRYLKKISFWIQFILITLLAAFLLEGYNSGNFLSSLGLITGLKMNLRAFVIMVGFSAIAVELKNPLIRSILYKRGFSSLYQSLSLAFSALPGIIAGLPGSKEVMKKRTSILSGLYSRSELLLQQFREEAGRRPPVIIITGNIGQGKTTFTGNLIKKLQKQDKKVSGFLSVGIHENNERIGFDLKDILTGNEMVISRKVPAEGWIRYGHYFFDPETFQKESGLIWEQSGHNTDLIVIDEVGPLEMNDSGWNDLIELFCKEKPVPMIWVVRKNLAGKAARKWNVGAVSIFNIEEDKEEDLLMLISTLTAK